eukprot:6968788-Prorocentrum_lima.AAC.1
MSGAFAATIASMQAVMSGFESLKHTIEVLQQVGERTHQRGERIQATITDQIRPTIEHLVH